jgi:hypothetical protein
LGVLHTMSLICKIVNCLQDKSQKRNEPMII